MSRSGVRPNSRRIAERLINVFSYVFGGRMLNVVHEADVRVGETYRVHIPRRENPLRLITGDPARAEVDSSLAQLARIHRTDFDLTATATRQQLGTEPARRGSG